MSRRNKTIVDIIAMLQHMCAGKSNRQIGDELGMDRRTAQKYREWAQGQGLLSGDLPNVSQLQKLQAETFGQPRPPQNVSTVEPYRSLVVKLRQENVEIAAIRDSLVRQGRQSGRVSQGDYDQLG